MKNLPSMNMPPATNGLRGAMLALLLAVGGALASWAWAQPGGHHGAGLMARASPERMGRMIDHMLDGVAASDAQRSQIKQIAQLAAADLKVQREASHALRAKAVQVFAAPNVDAAAAESLRQQMHAQLDQSSKRVLQAMLDISQVLSPEQRAKLGERFKQRDAQRQERMQRLARERPPR
ncbi:MAG: periplasmic heavy metal sensor [Burkholderiaceae bacterium]